MSNDKKFKYTHNNSTDYYLQTNNERDPYITCFNTSMINVAVDIIKLKTPTGSDKTGGYKQPEDQFDWYMHNSPEVKDWIDKYINDNKWVQDYLKDNGDIRELWEVECYCFNKWIGKKVCRINYNMTKHDFIEEIQNGRAVVTTGKFSNFAHAVSVVGFVTELNNFATDKDIYLIGDNISIPVEKDCSAVTEMIIDDSYGNPNDNYKPVGKNGNDVHLDKDKFFNAINKDTKNEKFYGILFDLV